MITYELGFLEGSRKEAIEEAIRLVKDTGRPAEVIVCRDISGEHSGGEECFCDPKIIVVHPTDL